MENITKNRIRWYNVATTLWLALFVAIGGALRGLPGMFGAHLLFGWLQERERKLFRMKVAVGAEEVKEFTDSVNNFKTTMANSQRRYLESFDIGRVGCSVCGSSYSPICGNDSPLCPQLRDVFPHRVDDEPPENNPWAWSWYQYHGYAPPENWPLTQPYTAPEAFDANPPQALLKKGRVYWSHHRNHLWDIGYAHVPQWYVDRWLSKAA
jgi:hypothetical protein